MNENKTNINWARRILAKTTLNLHKIRVFAIGLFAYCKKRRQNNVYLDRISIRKR